MRIRMSRTLIQYPVRKFSLYFFNSIHYPAHWPVDRPSPLRHRCTAQDQKGRYIIYYCSRNIIRSILVTKHIALKTDTEGWRRWYSTNAKSEDCWFSLPYSCITSPSSKEIECKFGSALAATIYIHFTGGTDFRPSHHRDVGNRSMISKPKGDSSRIPTRSRF